MKVANYDAPFLLGIQASSMERDQGGSVELQLNSCIVG